MNSSCATTSNKDNGICFTGIYCIPNDIPIQVQVKLVNIVQWYPAIIMKYQGTRQLTSLKWRFIIKQKPQYNDSEVTTKCKFKLSIVIPRLIPCFQNVLNCTNYTKCHFSNCDHASESDNLHVIETLRLQLWKFPVQYCMSKLRSPRRDTQTKKVSNGSTAQTIKF